MKVILPTHWYEYVKSINDLKQRRLTVEALFVYNETNDLQYVLNNTEVTAFIDGYIAAMEYHEVEPFTA